MSELVLAEFAAQYGLDPPALSPSTRARLACHRWPGNVRELQNAIKRLVMLGSDDSPRTRQPRPDTTALRPAPRARKCAPQDLAGQDEAATASIVTRAKRHLGARHVEGQLVREWARRSADSIGPDAPASR